MTIRQHSRKWTPSFILIILFLVTLACGVSSKKTIPTFDPNQVQTAIAGTFAVAQLQTLTASTSINSPTLNDTQVPTASPIPINTSKPEIPITSLVIPIDTLRSLSLSYLNTEMWCNEKDIQNIEYNNETRPNLLSVITAEQSTTKAWDGTLLGSVPCNDDTLREVSLQMYLQKWSKETNMRDAVELITAQYPVYSKARLPEILSSVDIKLPQETAMLRFVDGTPDGGAPKILILVTYRNNVTIVGVLVYPLMYDNYKLDELLAGYVITQYKLLKEAGY